MKKETMQAKLMEMLAKKNPELKEKLHETKKQVEARKGNIQEISEDEIQAFREAQGILYFLRAPALFQHKTCSHCGENFLVSRLYVANCSYTCIAKELEETTGVKWSRSGDIEALINEVYEGNEPIWIRNLSKLQRALEILTSQGSQLSRANTSPEVNTTMSVLTKS